MGACQGDTPVAHLCAEGILASHTPDREPRLHHSLAVCPWTSYLATLGLSFLIYKVGLMQSTSFQGDPEDGSDNTHGGVCHTRAGPCLPAGGFMLVDRAIALALSPTPRPPGGKVLSRTLPQGCGQGWMGLRLCPTIIFLHLVSSPGSPR